MTILKCCGFTQKEDVDYAIFLGIRCLGFIFYPKSPRCVTPDHARVLTQNLPPFVTTVGVFVNQSAEFICYTLQKVGLSCIQLHGEESPEFCDQFSFPVIKAFRIAVRQDLSAIPLYDVAAILLDSKVSSQYGGTGQAFDWNLAKEAKTLTKKPIILSGGIKIETVRQAVKDVSPYAIDVASGVESSPGKKDFQKMQKFIQELL